MRGTIRKIDANKDDRFKFFGEIAGDDGRTYRFNDYNWANSDTRLEEIQLDQEVEFELKDPTTRGYIYPKNIRLSGKEADKPIPNKYTPSSHSHGRFQDFIYVNTDIISLTLQEVIPGFSESANSIFRTLATHYNELQESDFKFSGFGRAETVDFPTGYRTPEGQDILLHCTKNKFEKIPWYADQILIAGKKMGSVFNIFAGNWYDIEQSIGDILPKCKDSAQDIVRAIEKRCLNSEEVLIYLDHGHTCPPEDADELYVPTGYFAPEGQEIYLLCTKRKGNRGYGWYFNSATYAGAGFKMFDKKLWLEKWSGPLEYDMLQELANQTLQEQWSFGAKENFGILRSYLQYTFSHQSQTDNIGYDVSGQYAAFNTGLPDRNTYKYLYAVFEHNEEQSAREVHPLYYQQSYCLQGFTVPGRGGLGKVLSEKIGLPKPPEYFSTRAETVWQLGFNDSNQITIPEYDDAHILIQRCDRIPLDFYRNQANNSPQLLAILNSADSDAEKYKQIRDLLKPVVIDHQPNAEITNLYRQLQNALENVIGMAVKKLAWNWRAVVPCYNPELENSCFLLPVSFSNYDQPDRAMIASCNATNQNNIYTIHTVIFLNWAYLDARLICRPESEWLVADKISDEEE